VKGDVLSHDLVKVRAEDRRQVQADVNGVRYTARDGYFHMRPDHAKAHLAHGNLPLPPAALPVGRAGGFRCAGCGFGSFFTTCSRCGGVCGREGGV
jgi:hypothetical protein